MSVKRFLDRLFPSNKDAHVIDAVAKGDIPLLRRALDAGGNVNAKGNDGATLMAAALAGQSEAVQVLLDRGAQVDARDTQGTTALMRAAIKDIASVRLLLNAGTEVNARDSFNWLDAADECIILRPHRNHSTVARFRG